MIVASRICDNNIIYRVGVNVNVVLNRADFQSRWSFARELKFYCTPSYLSQHEIFINKRDKVSDWNPSMLYFIGGIVTVSRKSIKPFPAAIFSTKHSAELVQFAFYFISNDEWELVEGMNRKVKREAMRTDRENIATFLETIVNLV